MKSSAFAGLWASWVYEKKKSSLFVSEFLLIKTSSRFDPVFHVVLVSIVGEREVGEIVSHLPLLIGSVTLSKTMDNETSFTKD